MAAGDLHPDPNSSVDTPPSDLDVTPAHDGVRQLRAEVRELVRSLRRVGVPQKAVAERARVSGAYLSQLTNLENQDYANKTPRAATTTAIVNALRALGDDREEDLRSVGAWARFTNGVAALERRVGIARQMIASPRLPLGPDAANYIRRYVDEALADAVTRPGVYVVTGPPASGKTSLLLNVLPRVRPAFERVVFLDLLAFPTESRKDRGAFELYLAQAISEASGLEPTGSTHPSSRVPALALRSAMDRLLASRVPALLVLDGANAVFETGVLKEQVRLWRQRAIADGPDSPYASLSLVLTASLGPDAGTSVQASSMLGLPEGTSFPVSWLNRTQVEALARLYSEGGDEERSIAREAWERFRGQPFLTQRYIYDADAVDGDLDELRSRIKDPHGDYQAHLQTLADLISLRPEAASAIWRLSEEPVSAPSWDTWLDLLAVTQRSVPEETDDPGRWFSCPFYADDLPRYVRRSAGFSNQQRFQP